MRLAKKEEIAKALGDGVLESRVNGKDYGPAYRTAEAIINNPVEGLEYVVPDDWNLNRKPQAWELLLAQHEEQVFGKIIIQDGNIHNWWKPLVNRIDILQALKTDAIVLHNNKLWRPQNYHVTRFNWSLELVRGPINEILTGFHNQPGSIAVLSNYWYSEAVIEDAYYSHG